MPHDFGSSGDVGPASRSWRRWYALRWGVWTLSNPIGWWGNVIVGHRVSHWRCQGMARSKRSSIVNEVENDFQIYCARCGNLRGRLAYLRFMDFTQNFFWRIPDSPLGFLFWTCPSMVGICAFATSIGLAQYHPYPRIKWGLDFLQLWWLCIDLGFLCGPVLSSGRLEAQGSVFGLGITGNRGF